MADATLSESVHVNVILGFIVVSCLANLVGTFYIGLNMLKRIRMLPAEIEL